VRVRIRKTPEEREIDGVQLHRLSPGVVRNVTASLASWLIVEGYAEPEMRRSYDEDAGIHGAAEPIPLAEDRRMTGHARSRA